MEIHDTDVSVWIWLVSKQKIFFTRKKFHWSLQTALPLLQACLPIALPRLQKYNNSSISLAHKISIFISDLYINLFIHCYSVLDARCWLDLLLIGAYFLDQELAVKVILTAMLTRNVALELAVDLVVLHQMTILQ